MSDHDRGAYTPHNDAPLVVRCAPEPGATGLPDHPADQPGDPGRPGRGHLHVLPLGACAAPVSRRFRSARRWATSSRRRRPRRQQPQDAGQGLQIYKAESGAQPAASAPPATFAPPPEQPQVRPAAPIATQPIAPPAARQPAPAPVAAAPAH